MKTIKYLLIIAIISTMAACKKDYTGQWVSIRPGKTLKGWKTDGSRTDFGYSGDTLLLTGRSTFYYSGRIHEARFRNFELLADIKTGPDAVAALWFHSGDASGYQVLINNTPTGEEHRKTGSLGSVRNIYKSMAADGEWFTLYVKVVKKHITVKVNDLLVVDYVEPDEPYRMDENRGMRIAQGTFALSSYTDRPVMISRLDVRPLPDRENPERTDAADERKDEIIRLQQVNFPVIDYHVHLKGWNREQAMAHSRKTGIFYGIAPNCGIGFPVTSDADIDAYLDTTRNMSCFTAMQGEGREWPATFSAEAREEFDYVFTDAMTFTDHKGRRTRLWMPDEVWIDIDREQYMDMIVDRTVKVLKEEPISIYVNPTFLPEQMMPDYDSLWTDVRIGKVVKALAAKGIALEINARYCIPHEKMIRAAKEAGIRFAFGTNNADSEMGKLEYCIEMMQKCGITGYDMFFPTVKPR
ncbi:MAG: DUF1080 domain-containing protein [Bacteroidales bacterium]|jgi:hypothetical protein|nr:DUF1080 domain-containing protein [Bacteroidales bacterium]